MGFWSQPWVKFQLYYLLANLRHKTDIKNVSVKATTEEKMGFTGEEQGIKAYAVCLLEEV